MFDHIADVLSRPALIRYAPDRYVLRFESMKVASADAAVRRLLAEGRIDRGSVLVDSSSGIYAYSLALACHRHGLQAHVIASTTVDAALKAQLTALGATYDQVPSSSSLKLDQNLRVRKVHDFLAANPNAHWMQQYHDDIHYDGYAPIAEAVREQIGSDALRIVGGVGSGASTGGLTRALRNTGADVELVGVQPFGSVSFGSEHLDDPDILIAGIGSAIPFGNINYTGYDRVDWMAFPYARGGTLELLSRTGIFAGLSSGAAYLVGEDTWRTGSERPQVVLAPDTGHRYTEALAPDGVLPEPLGSVKPKPVEHLGEIELPWSTIEWNRRPFVPSQRRAA